MTLGTFRCLPSEVSDWGAADPIGVNLVETQASEGERMPSQEPDTTYKLNSILTRGSDYSLIHY